MTDNIFLTGFMGSGKSSVGRILAQRLNRRFKDMDEILEAGLGASIPTIFERQGEAFFRDREHGLLAKLAQGARLVVATGGGVPVQDRNFRVMTRSGKIVFLDSDFDTLKNRISPEEKDRRPLWQDEGEARRLYESRAGAYADHDLAVRVDGRKSPEDLAEAIILALFPNRSLPVPLGETESPVTCTFNAPRRLRDLVGGRRTMVLIDRKVDRLHGTRYREALPEAHFFSLVASEKIKSLSGAKRVYDDLLAKRFNRDDLLIAVGGGVITDLGAFVGATYKRGLSFILAATSLLGCVDAAVGGKAAVNLDTAKNVVGAFTIPEAVVQDAFALVTLNRSQIGDGLVEAYKTGLVACPELSALIEQNKDGLVARDLPLLADTAAMSAKAKADVVGQDFKESGWRGILNFGHTYGHAVESWHHFKVSHGQAVAMGMIVAAILSRRRGLISENLQNRIVDTVQAISPTRASWPTAEQAWQIMLLDKKIRAGRLVFVLLEDIGKPVLVKDLTQEELTAALAEVID